MGRKRTGARKHVYFCLAGLIFFSLSGCALFKELREREETHESLVRGRRLLAQGDYEASLKEHQKVLSLSANGPPADEAVFDIGLIYAHSGNPKKDYRKALGFFRQVIRDFPRSPLVEQAKVWVGVLEANDKLSQLNERLNEVIRKSKQVDLEIEQKKREREK